MSIISLNLCYHLLLMRYWGYNFETLVRSYSILEHCRTIKTGKWVPRGRFSKYILFCRNEKFSTTPPSLHFLKLVTIMWLTWFLYIESISKFGLHRTYLFNVNQNLLIWFENNIWSFSANRTVRGESNLRSKFDFLLRFFAEYFKVF